MTKSIYALLFSLVLLLNNLYAFAEDEVLSEYPFYLEIQTMPMQADFRQARKIIAYNKGPVPVSISLTVTNPQNVRFQPIISGGNHAIVVPAKTQMVLTTATNLKADKPSTFQYNYKFFFGEPSSSQKRSTTYKVPFNSSIPLSAKSYNGIYSSNKSFAMDLVNAIQFYVPRQTDILAARRGIILDVKGLRDGTDDGKTTNLGNYILMMHEDGIMTYYANLTPHSVLVRPLQIVEPGEKIATSGHEFNQDLNYFIFSVLKNAGGHKSKSIQFVIDNGSDQLESTKLTGFVSEAQADDPYIKKFEGGYNSKRRKTTTIEELQDSVQTAKEKLIETNKQIAPEAEKGIAHRIASYAFYFIVAIAVIFVFGFMIKVLGTKKNDNSEKTKLSFSLIAKFEPLTVFMDVNHYKLYKRIAALLPITTDASLNTSYSSFLAPTTFKINVLNNPISNLHADIFLFQNTTLTPIAVIDVEHSMLSKLTSLVVHRKKSILKNAKLPYVTIKPNATDEEIVEVIRELHFSTLSKEKRK
ncbi:MAG: M23 family metallopeptidase [Methylophilus sp.]|uniref:M23 family metallopeptidase n=1 Tax=Methylophilus sp. TaxID=29541 RepID=UPI003FA15EC2